MPYIDIKKYPERNEEYEQNKIKYEWQPGDGYYSERSVFKVIENFNHSTNFEKFLLPNPNYQFSEGSPHGEGYNALCYAASYWEPQWCQLIVNQGGKHLLEIGNNAKGETPLICALKFSTDNHEFQDIVTLKVSKLLNLGANPNMANSEGKTPLWYAAEVNKYLPNIGKLLLKRAIINPAPSETGKKLIQLAKKEIINSVKLLELEEMYQLFNGKADKDCTLNNLSNDVFYEIVNKIIQEFELNSNLPKNYTNII